MAAKAEKAPEVSKSTQEEMDAGKKASQGKPENPTVEPEPVPRYSSLAEARAAKIIETPAIAVPPVVLNVDALAQSAALEPAEAAAEAAKKNPEGKFASSVKAAAEPLIKAAETQTEAAKAATEQAHAAADQAIKTAKAPPPPKPDAK